MTLHGDAWKAANDRVPEVLRNIYECNVDMDGASIFASACMQLSEELIELRGGAKVHPGDVRHLESLIEDVELGMCEDLDPTDGEELWACANAVYEIETAIAEHTRQVMLDAVKKHRATPSQPERTV